MKHVFDITEFGAVGDGKADCTAAVQKAVDAAASCRGAVVVPPGIYSVGSIRVSGEGVSIGGYPSWSFRSDASSVFRLRDKKAACMFDLTGAYGCTLNGLCLDGNGLGAGVHGVSVHHPIYNGGSKEDTPSLENCRIGHFTGDGVHFEHIWCFSVRHSMLHHNQGAGLYIDGWDAFILDNWFSGNQGGGIMGGAYTASVTCTGNRVEWNWTGGFVFRKGDSFNITGNFFDRSFGPALWLKQAGNVTVTGNIFRRSGAFDTPFELDSMNCHVLLEQCRETVITGNTMKKGVGDNGEGVLSPHHAMILDGCKSCIVKLNILSNSCVGEAIVIPKHDFEGILDENI